MPSVFFLKAWSYDYPDRAIPGVFESLQKGKARIGWSDADHLDLRELRERFQTGQSLDEDERDAYWGCWRFLEELSEEDYLIYPHQDGYRKFVIAQITGDYDYAPLGDSLDGNFRSFRPCHLLTPEPIDWDDEIVPPIIRSRLGLRGRFFKLREEFYSQHESLLQDLPHAGEREDTLNRRLGRISDDLTVYLPERLRIEFPRADLGWLCDELFKRMGYSTRWQEGPGERGSDIVVTAGLPLIEKDFTIGVQVFAFEETVSADSLQPKLSQLLNGWNANALDYGVLLTTGICDCPARDLVRNHNKADRSRPVRLIEGKELARLFLQYFGSDLSHSNED